MRTLCCLFLLWCASLGSALADARVDGKALFDGVCAHCHDRDLPRMPNRAALATKPPQDIFTTISAGVMAPYARGLGAAERRAIA